jgi:B-box zinc finger
MCANCGADAPLYCKACAAALCAECSKFVHGAAPFTKMMSKHEPRPREEAAFDMLVARLGGDPAYPSHCSRPYPQGGSRRLRSASFGRDSLPRRALYSQGTRRCDAA